MICKLCNEDKELSQSHIIPEFFYLPLYDEKHRIQRKSFNLQVDVKRVYEQKGLREKLFCSDCEKIINEYETYACYLWKNKFLNISKEFNYLSDIDYHKFKMFLISVIWRCGITKKQEFSIDLGIHQEKMRKMILNNNPGYYDQYGCIISAMVLENNEIVDDLIWMETEFKIEGHRCYRLIFGGFIWIFFVSSHKPPDLALNLFIQNSGELLIKKAKLSEIQFMMKHAENLFS